MKYIYHIILLAVVISATACVKLSFDKETWKSTSSVTKIDDVDFSISIWSDNSNMLRNKSCGPWKVHVLCSSSEQRLINVLGLWVHTNEGVQKVYSGSVILPMDQIRKDGIWTGSWNRETSPVSINPKYYETQKLIVEVEVSVDKKAPQRYSKIFKPVHITGKETVNFLTM